MPSADQVPVTSTHSKMLWPEWVVLIAGSTGFALRAVRPPNRHITPDVRHDLVMPRARRVLCTAHLSPSSPTPSWQACWRARWLRPWWDAAPAPAVRETSNGTWHMLQSRPGTAAASGRTATHNGVSTDGGRLHCLPHRHREPERPTLRYRGRLS